MSPRSMSPVGQPTRGTTGTNRLRRVDRWIARHPVLRGAQHPLVVDLGYGASGVTTFELAARLEAVHPTAEVCGLELDQTRVERARNQLAAVRAGLGPFSPATRVSFARGGFEIPTSRRPHVIRAFNVLRQYDEGDVAQAWAQMCARLQPGGILIDGTCDEIGRVMSWITIDAAGAPRSLTLSLRLRSLASPTIVAERLPKALIHRNVEGERVHALIGALGQQWERTADIGTFSPVQRWKATLHNLRDAGWPLLERHRWRLGEVTVPWEAAAPHPG